MKKQRILMGFAAGALALGLSFGASAADRYVFDTAHTNLAFTVNHLGFSNMIGQFQEFDGEFTFDGSSVDGMSVSMTVKTESIDTDHTDRDNHLRSPDFFNVQEFPEMKFVSKSAESTGEKTAKLTGDLTILGVTQPLTLDVTFNNAAPSPFDPNTFIAGFSARGSIMRSAYGMKYGVPALGDEVKLMIEAEGTRQ